MMLALLGAAVGVPYVMSGSSGLGERLSSLWPDASKGPKSTPPAALEPSGEIKAARSPDGPGALLYPNQLPIEGLPTTRLEEVIRMDVSKEWVYGRWSRKSTGVVHPDWFGVRVPLVTGTNLNDLAGSLTYYFDGSGRVQHIAFRGRTGDTTRLVALLTGKYGLEWQQPEFAGEQLYQIRWSGHPISELRTRPAPVLWGSAPHTSFQVELELARPGSSRYLPARYQNPPSTK
jgi:hypothetical protein